MNAKIINKAIDETNNPDQHVKYNTVEEFLGSLKNLQNQLKITQTSTFRSKFKKIKSKVTPKITNEIINSIETFLQSPLNPPD